MAVINEIELYIVKDSRFNLNPIFPEILNTPLSKINDVDGKSYISYSWRQKRQLMDQGYEVKPSDCPPIRNINSYGFEVFASGYSKIVKHENPKERLTTEKDATFGYFTHSGEKCNYSDSTFLSGWLANSRYVKIITGLTVYCPFGYGLYQGPIPYKEYEGLQVLSAIEFNNSLELIEIEGIKHFCVELNFVCSIESKIVEIKKGDSLGIFYPVLPKRKIKLTSL